MVSVVSGDGDAHEVLCADPAGDGELRYLPFQADRPFAADNATLTSTTNAADRYHPPRHPNARIWDMLASLCGHSVSNTLRRAAR
jgi:hypothetical protein